MNNIKTRIKVRHFLNGKRVTSAYTIEICVNKKWTPLGDDNGYKKFATKDEAMAECLTLKEATIAP